jgi:hypothetical protein
MRIALHLAVLFVACARSEGTPHRGASSDDAPRQQAGSLAATSKKAPTSPELVERAEKILAEHSNEPVGTEIPFTLNGQRYVARLELHDNPDGSPERPSGQHKGVTVYIAP